MHHTNNESTFHSSSRVWFITGSSTGFGRALAEAVIARGERVVATARRPEQVKDLAMRAPERVLTVSLDVTDEDQVRGAVSRAMKQFGQIDVLVNNAGYGLFGAVEEASAKEVRRQFETNVFGLLNVTRAVLPVMRAQHRGHILMMSSVGGIVSAWGSGIYNGSKFAVEGISEALAQQAAPLGIHVTLIEPGVFHTDFASRSLQWAQREIEDYAQTRELVRQFMEQIGDQPFGEPALAAAAMIQIVEAPEPPLRLALGADALQMIRGKLASMTQELERWEHLSLTTTPPGNVPS